MTKARTLADNYAADINGITAGTGITGGGTSGTVTITNEMATTITAKGDLIVGTGNATYDNLAVGTNGYTLVADSNESLGVKWQAPAGGGKVLQVVQGISTTETTIQTTSYTDSTLSASITPSAATSKILVLTFQQTLIDRDADATECYVQLLRDSTAINAPTDYTFNFATTGSGATEVYFGAPYNIVYLDSPNTTSAITYKTQGKLARTANSNRLRFQLNSSPSVIVLIEIGA